MGRAKALVELEGRLLVERGLALLRDADCDPCVVVLGAEAAEVRRRADLTGADVVVADRWAQGQSVSVGLGLSRLLHRPAPPAATVVALVDQPLVTPASVRLLIDAWHGGALAVAASLDGRTGPPVLLDRALWREILPHLQGDEGAGPWLRAHHDRVTRVDIGGVADTLDVDTPADLDAVRRRLRADAAGEPPSDR